MIIEAWFYVSEGLPPRVSVPDQIEKPERYSFQDFEPPVMVGVWMRHPGVTRTYDLRRVAAQWDGPPLTGADLVDARRLLTQRFAAEWLAEQEQEEGGE
jgi:hypothetical protein